MSVFYGLTCDGCGARYDKFHFRNIGGVRGMAKPLGWTNPKPGRDLCPECSVKQAERAKQENQNGYL